MTSKEHETGRPPVPPTESPSDPLLNPAHQPARKREQSHKHKNSDDHIRNRIALSEATPEARPRIERRADEKCEAQKAPVRTKADQFVTELFISPGPRQPPYEKTEPIKKHRDKGRVRRNVCVHDCGPIAALSRCCASESESRYR